MRVIPGIELGWCTKLFKLGNTSRLGKVQGYAGKTEFTVPSSYAMLDLVDTSAVSNNSTLSAHISSCCTRAGASMPALLCIASCSSRSLVQLALRRHVNA